MSVGEFCILCLDLGIAPGVALENAKVRKALVAKDAEPVAKLLREEF